MKKIQFKKYILIIGAILLLSNCGGNSGSAYITGVIKDGSGKWLYFEELTPERIIVIDSVKIGSDGSFKIKKSAHGMNYYRLRLGAEEKPNQYASPTNIIVFISDSTEKLTVNGNAASLNKDYEITGSVETDLLKEINAFLIKGEQTIDSLNQQYNENPQSFDKVQGELIFNGVQEKRADFMKAFILAHPENFVTLQALPFVNYESDLELYKTTSALLSKNFPTNGWVMNLSARVQQMNLLANGTEAPDFTVKTPDDKNISLKDFRGKVVLLDFWASWCRPCRQENPNVVAAYKKFKDKGFTIFGVSLDQSKDAWIKAIKDDGLTWAHGSDLMYWDSQPAKLYNVNSIPFNFLIDKEGKIIGRNLHGPDLENKLAEILN